jgi:hypothetical protein
VLLTAACAPHGCLCSSQLRACDPYSCPCMLCLCCSSHLPLLLAAVTSHCFI